MRWFVPPKRYRPPKRAIDSEYFFNRGTGRPPARSAGRPTWRPRFGGDAQIVGRFAQGSTAEVSQAHESSHPRLDRGQAVEGVVDRKDVLIGVGPGKTVQVDRHPPSAPLGHAGAGVIDEDAPHGPGGGEEVTARPGRRRSLGRFSGHLSGEGLGALSERSVP